MKWVKYLLLMSIGITFVFSSLNVVTRIKTENSSNRVEVTVDYKQIYMNSKRGEDDFQSKIHDTLVKRGVTSIGLNENTLEELENRDFIHVMSGSELEKNLWSQVHNIPIQKHYTYVLIPENEKREEIVKVIKESQLGTAKSYKLNKTLVLEVDKRKVDIFDAPLLFLQSDYDSLSTTYNIVPRISNKWGDRSHLVEQQLKKWNSEKKLSVVLFSGSEVLGYEELEEKVKVTPSKTIMNEIGIGVIESFSDKDKQKGINSYVVDGHYNMVRVHSLSKEQLETMSFVDTYRLTTKAAKERNIRMFYINTFYLQNETETEEEYLEKLDYALKPVILGMKESGYELSKAEPFKQKNSDIMGKLGVTGGLVGSMMLLIYVATILLKKYAIPNLDKLLIGTMVSGVLFILSTNFSGHAGLLVKVASLGLSVLLPIWSALHISSVLNKMELNEKSILKKIALPVLSLYVVGITYLISMNYSIAHITNTEPFRGVSLTLTVPPLLVAIITAIMLRKSITIKTLLLHKIRIVDVLIIGLIGAFLLFYVSRSGNGGTLLPFEALIRGWLEDKLPWRPRTKEIFFAFPLLVIMIGFWNKTKWAKVLLPFVTVGFASVFNTFTHFHTPIVASFGRSVLSVALGLVFGMIAYRLLNSVYQRVVEIKKMRSNI